MQNETWIYFSVYYGKHFKFTGDIGDTGDTSDMGKGKSEILKKENTM